MHTVNQWLFELFVVDTGMNGAQTKQRMEIPIYTYAPNINDMTMDGVIRLTEARYATDEQKMCSGAGRKKGSLILSRCLFIAFVAVDNVSFPSDDSIILVTCPPAATEFNSTHSGFLLSFHKSSLLYQPPSTPFPRVMRIDKNGNQTKKKSQLNTHSVSE